MKILKLLNKKNFFILFFLFFTSIVNADEKPIDIWNIDKKEIEENKTTNNSEISNGENILQENIEPSVFGMQDQNQKSIINLDEKFDSKEIKIIGLFDPQNFDLNVDMWFFKTSFLIFLFKKAPPPRDTTIPLFFISSKVIFSSYSLKNFSPLFLNIFGIFILSLFSM